MISKIFIKLNLIYKKKSNYFKFYLNIYIKDKYLYMIKLSYYKIFVNLNLYILSFFFKKTLKTS